MMTDYIPSATIQIEAKAPATSDQKIILQVSDSNWNLFELYKKTSETRISIATLIPSSAETWVGYVQICIFPTGMVHVYVCTCTPLTEDTIAMLRQYGIAHFSVGLDMVSGRTPDQNARIAEYLLENFTIEDAYFAGVFSELVTFKSVIREPSKTRINVSCTKEDATCTEFRPMQDGSWFRTFWVFEIPGEEKFIQVRYPDQIHTAHTCKGEEAKSMAKRLLDNIFFLEEKYETILGSLL
jgi:hypothetical protein